MAACNPAPPDAAGAGRWPWQAATSRRLRSRAPARRWPTCCPPQWCVRCRLSWLALLAALQHAWVCRPLDLTTSHSLFPLSSPSCWPRRGTARPRTLTARWRSCCCLRASWPSRWDRATSPRLRALMFSPPCRLRADPTPPTCALTPDLLPLDPLPDPPGGGRLPRAAQVQRPALRLHHRRRGQGPAAGGPGQAGGLQVPGVAHGWSPCGACRCMSLRVQPSGVVGRLPLLSSHLPAVRRSRPPAHSRTSWWPRQDACWTWCKRARCSWVSASACL